MKPEKTILLKDALYRLDKGEVCSLVVVKADEKRGTAGEIVTYRKCAKENAGVGKVTPTRINVNSSAIFNTKNPNHYYNSTRNILLLDTKEKRKFHIRLLLRYNGMKVI